MADGYKFRQLASASGKCVSTLQKVIDHHLAQVPTQELVDMSDIKNIVVDGSYIWKRKLPAFIVMNSKSGKLIRGEYDFNENNAEKLITLFTLLRGYGLTPESATIDGNPTVIGSLQAVWPSIVIQRCLVHIQRQGSVWCRITPKTTLAKKLRELFVQITNIRTAKQRDDFLTELKHWEFKYGQMIQAKPERGPVFSDVKRARSVLLKALPNMFHFLQDEQIPWSTNLAEGYFSNMKSRYREHRGLAPQKRSFFFNWYFILKP